MAKYLAKRAIAFVIIIFFVSLGTFFLVHLLPGNPAVAILGPLQSPSAIAQVDRQLGLDHPLWQQYFFWIGHVFEGKLGTNFENGRPVISTINQEYKVTLVIIVMSQVIALAVAIPLAIQAARKPNKIFDRIATAMSFGFLALPAFVLTPLAVFLFCIELHVFPGPASYNATVPILSNLKSLLLPSIIVAVGSIVIYFRLLRNDCIATLNEDFILMARAKGLSERRVLFRHVFRPSSIALLASAGVNIAGLVGGTFVVEYLLQLPGMGFALVKSISQRDFAQVQGIVLVVAVAIVALNFIVDFLFTVVDPRIARD